MPYKNKADDWLFLADSDLKAAEALLKEKIYHMAAFHSQQAAEKSLKAFIFTKKQAIPKVHSLTKLFYEASKYALKNVNGSDAAFLDQFYSPTRYPDVLPGSLAESLPGRNDAVKAIAAGLRIYRAIKKMIAGNAKINS